MQKSLFKNTLYMYMKKNFIKNKPNYMYFCLCHKKFHMKIVFYKKKNLFWSLEKKGCKTS